MKQMLSASCSMAPDSRRSESCGRLLFSLRVSTARLSWLSAMTGRLSSLASCFRPREISLISCSREFAPFSRPSSAAGSRRRRGRCAASSRPSLDRSGRTRPAGAAPSTRSSRIESAGVSSTQMVRLPRCDAACVSLLQSLGVEHARAHLAHVDPRLRAEHAVGDLLARHLEREDDDAVARLLPALVRVAARSRAAAGCATLTAMFRTKLVLPMPGRAATIVSSPSCRPLVMPVVAVEAGRDAGDAARRARWPSSMRLEGLAASRRAAGRRSLDSRRARDVVDGLLGRVDERLRLAVVGVALRRSRAGTRG